MRIFTQKKVDLMLSEKLFKAKWGEMYLILVLKYHTSSSTQILKIWRFMSKLYFLSWIWSQLEEIVVAL